jgi:hypothetical protein
MLLLLLLLRKSGDKKAGGWDYSAVGCVHGRHMLLLGGQSR